MIAASCLGALVPRGLSTINTPVDTLPKCPRYHASPTLTQDKLKTDRGIETGGTGEREGHMPRTQAGGRRQAGQVAMRAACVPCLEVGFPTRSA
ncbi:hypothetical protein CCHR01_18095 [Colletotrichum chrysophilum]|uniref:Uncharacterized protein n=1 Tax=Colletotrichum chrysophilum TaxID=1836956 RepID=A0AAD9E8G8_9PEZI|nr:hypothetical protein CCHR01_18095 [Colletotrichum chrysophilum]